MPIRNSADKTFSSVFLSINNVLVGGNKSQETEFHLLLHLLGKMYFIADFSRTGMTPGSMSMSTAALVREFATSTLWKRGLILQIAKQDLKKIGLVFFGKFFFFGFWFSAKF